MSAADLIAVLGARHLRYDIGNPQNPENDHLIFSKGHASPLLYAFYKAAGAITDSELLTFRQRGSRLEGHPTPHLPWVDVATGSLGQGLPIGVGVALAGRYLEQRPYRVWVLCGDSELAEGSFAEAFEHAAYNDLNNVTAILDVNRLGQSRPTRHGWDTEAYARRIGAMGWHTVQIDGHDVAAIDQAYAMAAAANRPTAIIARTRKGRGVAAVEDREGHHGKPVPDPEEAIAELGGPRDLTLRLRPPERRTGRHQTQKTGQTDRAERAEPRRSAGAPPIDRTTAPATPSYSEGDKVATRDAFGRALEALAASRQDVIALDGEVSDSTRTQFTEQTVPEQFFEFYIAEQQMVAAAIGMQVRGYRPFATTFAAFFTRAHDFIRMAAISQANLCLVGSHAGVAIGEDGPSQMGLEDLAMFRATHSSTVLCPCDANQTVALTDQLADRDGIVYLRTHRGGTPVIYPPGETFPIGGSRTVRSGSDDRVTIVATGVTVHEAIAAADLLAREGIGARVVDAYSVKPIDARTIRAAAQETGRILTVEDHWPEGGLADAVSDALADAETRVRTIRLGVRGMPSSAAAEDQLHRAGIDRTTIANTARSFARR